MTWGGGFVTTALAAQTGVFHACAMRAKSEGGYRLFFKLCLCRSTFNQKTIKHFARRGVAKSGGRSGV